MLLRQLPRNSALARAVDPSLADWTVTDELAALQCELLDLGNRQQYMYITGGKAKMPTPLRVRRPRDGELQAMAAEAIRVVDQPKMSDHSEVVKFFGGTVHYFPDPNSPAPETGE